MVPSRLTLRNFLSYADASPPIELAGIGLACLCGENGHGKSTLIDAITWALWGKARGRSDDLLVHHGRRDMEVDLEFLVGEAKYRVVRRRQRIGLKSTGRPSLEFQIWSDAQWRPLTEPTIHQTEAAVERTLRLSYETFINSALLLQGKSDLFTAAGAANRKRVLAEILNLGQYETFESRAKEQRRELAQEAFQLTAALAEITPRLAVLPRHEEERAEKQVELDQVVAERVERTAALQAAQSAQAARERQQADLQEAEQARRRDQQALHDAEAELARVHALIALDEPLAAAEPAIRAGYDRLQAARAAEQRWIEKLIQQQQIDQQIEPLRQAIGRAESTLERDLALARAERDRVAAAAAGLPALERQLRETEARAATFGERSAEIEGQLQQQRRLQETVVRLITENEQLSRSGNEKTVRVAELRAAEQRGEVDCPLCRTALGAGGLQQIEETYQEEVRQEQALSEINLTLIEHTTREIARLERAIRSLQTQLDRDRNAVTRELGSTRLLMEQARTASDRLNEIVPVVDDLARRLASGHFADESRRALAVLEREREAIGFDPRQHKDAARRAEQQREYERRHQDLVQALARLSANRPAMQRQQVVVEAARDRLIETEARAISLGAAVAAQPDLTGQVRELEARLHTLTERRTALDQRVGGLDQIIRECRALEALERQKRSRLETVRAQEEIYAELVMAFGKRGVQAFIIDAVLPELEEEANRLLAGMTNGRMRISLETQRETRAGDLAETLDIVIADEWGTRDYEMYSGGEAFRINLALRIALSKLLARRSGAPLPTLIIDEGFGSQDATGRELLIEAVTAIQHDFQCLLVVTHIEELKAQFDTRIEVVKDGNGSTARVVRV